MVELLIFVVVEADFEKKSQLTTKKIMKNYSTCIKGDRTELIFCPEDMFKAVLV